MKSVAQVLYRRLRATSALAPVFSPSSLFASGEQGVWLDNSDFTTLFQDAAGTTPVTGYEQFVGLRLDKSKSGVGTNGAKRVNLLSWTEAFDNAAWTKAGTQVTADQTAAPNGTTTADKVNANASGAIAVLHSPLATIGNISRVGSVYLKPGTWRYVTFALEVYSGTAQWVACTVDLNTGTITKTGAGAAGTYVSSSISAAANGFYLVTLTGVLPAGTDFAAAELSFADSATPSYGSYGRVNVTGTAADYFYVWGADLRLASEAATLPTYQRITSDWPATIPGNHAYQTNINARAVLSARYNQLTYTEQFDNAVWQKINVTGTYNTLDTTDPLGGNTADKFLETVTNGGHYVDATSGIPVSINTAYTRSVCVKSAGRQWIALDMYDTTSRYTYFDIQNGVIGTIAPGTTASITSLGNGWFRCAITRVVSQTSVFLATLSAPSDNGNVLFVGDVTKGFYIWGADLRVANESSALPVYQRVGAAVNGTSTSIGTPDYDTVGFPAYLRYDGGDWYQTNSINFSTFTWDGQTRRNLVDAPTNFASSTWAKAGGGGGALPNPAPVVTQNQIAPDGTLTACKLDLAAVDNPGDYSACDFTFSVPTSATYTGSMYVKAATEADVGKFIQVYFYDGTARGIKVTMTADWQRVSTGPIFLPSGSRIFAVGTLGFGAGIAITNQGPVSAVVWGAQAELGSTVTAFQNIGTDRMSVFTGVRKLVDSVDVGTIVELSSDTGSNNGAFLLTGRNIYDSAYYDFVPKGTAIQIVAETSGAFAAPNTAILSALSNISGDLSSLRINAVLEAQSAGDLGTGNFGNYPLYIGARGGNSFYFNGREYETIVLGRAVTATELANTEDYMETQTFGKNMAYVYSDELTTSLGELITAADGDQIYMTVTYQ